MESECLLGSGLSTGSKSVATAFLRIRKAAFVLSQEADRGRSNAISVEHTD